MPQTDRRHHHGASTMLDQSRRRFITLLGGAAAAWPLAARAQEPGRVYRLGVLSSIARDTPQVSAAYEELRRAGFVEGRNLLVVAGGTAFAQMSLHGRHRPSLRRASMPSTLEAKLPSAPPKQQPA